LRKSISVLVSLVLCLAILLPAPAAAVADVNGTIAPPALKKVPEKITKHGDTRIDNYSWLRNQDDPDVKAHLEAENRYSELIMADSQQLQNDIYSEMLQHMQQNYISPPVTIDQYIYYTRMESGQNFPLICRKKDSPDAAEEILLNYNLITGNNPALQLGAIDISQDHSKLAYTLDYSGDEKYVLYIKDLNTGQTLPEVLTEISGNVYWLNETLIYTRLDRDGYPRYLYRHRLETSFAEDELIYEETDNNFYITTEISNDHEYLLINCVGIYASEVLCLSKEPEAEPRVVLPRWFGIFYRVQHIPDSFIILTSDSSPNLRLVKAPEDSPLPGSWKNLLPRREDVSILDFLVCRDYLVVQELHDGLQKIRIVKWNTGETHYLKLPETSFEVTLDYSYFDDNAFSYYYTSPVTPDSLYCYNIQKQESELIDQLQVDGYDPSQYACEQLYAKTEDGTLVPLTLLYKKGMVRDGSNPVIMEGYGAYGISRALLFDSDLIPLLNRGVIYAIAHVRGGGEKGSNWHYDGALLRKKNSFTDFIACAEFLIDQGYTSSNNLAISGGSAGGLLVGAVVNMRPDLFQVAVAQVPAVDILNILTDSSNPGRSFQFREWGNPAYRSYYDYIRSYSPYDNVSNQEYPHMLVTAGFNDPRIPYWGPAKWTAKLREYKTDDNIILLKTSMSSGHSGTDGRYESLKETAFIYAFILKYLEV